jgi:hypothetical protein
MQADFARNMMRRHVLSGVQMQAHQLQMLCADQADIAGVAFRWRCGKVDDLK